MSNRGRMSARKPYRGDPDDPRFSLQRPPGVNAQTRRRRSQSRSGSRRSSNPPILGNSEGKRALAAVPVNYSYESMMRDIRYRWNREIYEAKRKAARARRFAALAARAADEDTSRQAAAVDAHRAAEEAAAAAPPEEADRAGAAVAATAAAQSLVAEAAQRAAAFAAKAAAQAQQAEDELAGLEKLLFKMKVG